MIWRGERGKKVLEEAVLEARTSTLVDGKVTEKVQQGILRALNKASPQDEALPIHGHGLGRH